MPSPIGECLKQQSELHILIWTSRRGYIYKAVLLGAFSSAGIPYKVISPTALVFLKMFLKEKVSIMAQSSALFCPHYITESRHNTPFS